MQHHEFASKFSRERVDREKGIIHGVAVATEGPAQGHGCHLDAKTLEQIRDKGAEFQNGLKVKADHGTGIFATAAHLKDFRIDNSNPKELVLRADMHVLESEVNRDKLFEMAEKMPDNFGLSISFDGPDEKIGKKKFARCEKLFSTDIVGEPAANRRGLFSAARCEKHDAPMEDGKCAKCDEETAAKEKEGKDDESKEFAQTLLRSLDQGINKVARQFQNDNHDEKGRFAAADGASSAAAEHTNSLGGSAATLMATGYGPSITDTSYDRGARSAFHQGMAREHGRLAKAAEAVGAKEFVAKHEAARDAHRSAAELQLGLHKEARAARENARQNNPLKPTTKASLDKDAEENRVAAQIAQWSKKDLDNPQARLLSILDDGIRKFGNDNHDEKGRFASGDGGGGGSEAPWSAEDDAKVAATPYNSQWGAGSVGKTARLGWTTASGKHVITGMNGNEYASGATRRDALLDLKSNYKGADAHIGYLKEAVGRAEPEKYDLDNPQARLLSILDDGIRKFGNDSHDEKGRFASGDGGGGSEAAANSHEALARSSRLGMSEKGLEGRALITKGLTTGSSEDAAKGHAIMADSHTFYADKYKNSESSITRRLSFEHNAAATAHSKAAQAHAATSSEAPAAPQKPLDAEQFASRHGSAVDTYGSPQLHAKIAELQAAGHKFKAVMSDTGAVSDKRIDKLTTSGWSLLHHEKNDESSEALFHRAK